jgi:hypothetical protein
MCAWARVPLGWATPAEERHGQQEFSFCWAVCCFNAGKSIIIPGVRDELDAHNSNLSGNI